MPEACFLCLDSSEFMRNGDQHPNRFFVVQEAATLLANAKTSANAENTVGFLTLGGNACTVFETLTSDVDRVMSTMSKISISGKQCHFSKGLQIACLALSHRTNPRAEKRIVAFIGTPLGETDGELEKLAKKLRKESVAVDVVSVGVPSNVPRLTAFVERLSNNGNSRFLSVPAKVPLIDSLMSSAIFMGEDSSVSGGGFNGSSAGFSVDPTMDPEMVLAIQMSLEEEERRQAAAAALNSNAAESETVERTDINMDEEALSLENMTEEEMLRRALLLSLQEANKGQAAAGSNATNTADDEAFANELEKELERQSKEETLQGKHDDQNEEKED
ncbi:proteasome regulatory non-ATP-ase subunit 10 [Trypanosoma equiperdum]|uniref:Proteasome regulatory non-ATP-ase subunit 10 n=3 Tax=Trypanozoon TaxID=39700 RepID=Q57YH3_TRYB2|nr:proteasome regulatory non-ATP-ase subunit 10 [Trypanosoma brucei brucei TREU927]AAX69345.1 proteasome regulatory non-ATP-ase subunit 10 [Trypanosoma brucei]AAZ12828.1 proteasome regulatory non-ATP-ase subunit 10 [Trypanosoma brucei brucei TREU927]RHW71052.1 proteasome regulatory non-ATP-ase subunit 10 [Trypanosoma brucei equiperdum]SCU68936.1 proteasome regulatory non-ATP-ase subunit 10 [Trypanosoma equiperdum]